MRLLIVGSGDIMAELKNCLGQLPAYEVVELPEPKDIQTCYSYVVKPEDDIPLSEVGFSIRVYTQLKRLSYNRTTMLSDLVGHPVDDVTRIRQFGDKGLAETEARLNSMGYALCPPYRGSNAEIAELGILRSTKHSLWEVGVVYIRHLTNRTQRELEDMLLCEPRVPTAKIGDILQEIGDRLHGIGYSFAPE